MVSPLCVNQDATRYNQMSTSSNPLDLLLPIHTQPLCAIFFRGRDLFLERERARAQQRDRERGAFGVVLFRSASKMLDLSTKTHWKQQLFIMLQYFK